MTDHSFICPDISGRGESADCVLQLGYLGFGVGGPTSWNDFASNLLGLQKNSEVIDGWSIHRMDDRHVRFLLRHADRDAPLFAGWEARDAAAMRRLAAHAEARGIDVCMSTSAKCEARGVLDFVSCDDPDGFRVEIFHGPKLMPGTFASPRGVRFVTGDGGLGHIVLTTSDLEATTSFYIDILGIRISDYIMPLRNGGRYKLTFLNANHRHHSLALVGGLTNDMRQSGKPVSHVMVEHEHVDDVGLAFDDVQSCGVKSNLIGRHTNDRMISFYAGTPFGFNIELGGGAITIVPEERRISQYDRTSIWGHGEVKHRVVEPDNDH